jgi:uncharacterized protein
MADVLTRLARLTGENKYRDAAEKALAYFANAYTNYGFMAADYARAVSHFINEPVTVHIVGAMMDARTRELHNAALDESAPGKIVQLLDPGRDQVRIAQLGYPIGDVPLAYVCVGQKCLAPVNEARGVIEGMKQIIT